MKKYALLVTLLLSITTLVHADAISGSLPLVLFNAQQNGANLLVSTKETALSSLTSGTGTGDFSIIPLNTPFGAFSLLNTAVLSGGGFNMSNALFGSFSATGGSIVQQTGNFLSVDLTGIVTPGAAFPGETASPADVHISFTQTGTSLSGSYTLATTAPIPEPGTMGLLGSGLLLGGIALKRYLL